MPAAVLRVPPRREAGQAARGVCGAERTGRLPGGGGGVSGHPADPATGPEAVGKLRERFSLARVVLVGDRGLLPQARIKALRCHPGQGWVSALRAPQVRVRIEREALDLSLFDERNLAALASSAYPGERLVACRGPLPAADRKRTREARLAATEDGLARVAREAARWTRTPLGAAELGRKVGRVLERHKMAKYFAWKVVDGQLHYRRAVEQSAAEAHLDGISVLRTSEPVERLSVVATVRTDKGPVDVERRFRALPGQAIRVRPLHPREERRGRHGRRLPHKEEHVALLASREEAAASLQSTQHPPDFIAPLVQLTGRRPRSHPAPPRRPHGRIPQRHGQGPRLGARGRPGPQHRGSPWRRTNRRRGPRGRSPGPARTTASRRTVWARCSPHWPRAVAIPAGWRPIPPRQRLRWARSPPPPSTAPPY